MGGLIEGRREERRGEREGWMIWLGGLMEGGRRRGSKKEGRKGGGQGRRKERVRSRGSVLKIKC